MLSGETISSMPEEESIERAREDETRRQIAFHPSGRICPRRNGTYWGGRTRRSFARTGDRHRSVQGADSWSKAASAKAGQSANETSSQARSRERPHRPSQKAFA